MSRDGMGDVEVHEKCNATIFFLSQSYRKTCATSTKARAKLNNNRRKKHFWSVEVLVEKLRSEIVLPHISNLSQIRSD